MLTLIALLMNFTPAHALENVTTPFTLTCEGSSGFLSYVQTAEGLAYEINLPTKHFHGLVKPYLVSGSHWEQGVADLIDPDYQKGSLWLSVSAIHGHKQWHPPTEGCMPSRSMTAPCLPVHNPGYYSNMPDEWLSVMIDVTDKSKPIFMSLDLFESKTYDLGANPHCELSGL